MEKSKINNRKDKFEKCVVSILTKNGLDVEYTGELPGHRYDAEIIKNNKRYGVEIKNPRGKYCSISYIKRIAAQLSMSKNENKLFGNPILIIGNQIPLEDQNIIKEYNNVMIVDIIDLLYLSEKFEKLKVELLSMLDYSISDAEIKKPNTIFFNEFFSDTQNLNNISQVVNNVESEDMFGNKLLEKLKNMDNNKVNWREYEDICEEILKYLFNNELGLWQRQKNSNSGVFRFDLICKIKDEEVSPFWKILQKYFFSKYIVFEFKKYKKKINQLQIFTTEKYLYTKALRAVAIIVSYKGHNSNADKVIRGILRENGKLILSINNEDMIHMIEMKMKNDIPSDYLYEKLDELLISLEK